MSEVNFMFYYYKWEGESTDNISHTLQLHNWLRGEARNVNVTECHSRNIKHGKSLSSITSVFTVWIHYDEDSGNLTHRNV